MPKLEMMLTANKEQFSSALPLLLKKSIYIVGALWEAEIKHVSAFHLFC